MFFYLLSVHWRNYLVKPDGKDTSFLLIIYQFYLKKEKMLVVLHISIQRTSIFKKLLLAYGEDINIFVFDSKAPNWDNFQAFLDGEVRYLSLKKVCPNEAQELFDAAKKAAQHRYATYVRMSKIDYSAE